MKKIAVITRILPHWRREIFQSIHNEFSENNMEIVFVYDPTAEVNGCHISSGKLESINSYILSIKKFNKFEYLSGLWKVLHNYKPDYLVVESNPKFISNFQLLFYKILCKKVQIWGWSSGYFRKNTRLLFFLRKIYYKLYDGLFVYHSLAKQVFLEEVKFKKQVIIVGNSPGDKYIFDNIRNITHKEILTIRNSYLKLDNEILVLFVGKLTKSKKVEILIQAANHLKQEGYKFLIIGDGPLRKELEVLNKSYNNSNVYFLGKVVENVNKYFQSCDVFVMPGTGGLAIIQALYNRMPIITSYGDGMGIDAVINNVNGYINKDITVEFLVEALLKLKDKNQLKLFSNNSAKRALDFTTKMISRKIVNSIIQEEEKVTNI